MFSLATSFNNTDTSYTNNLNATSSYNYQNDTQNADYSSTPKALEFETFDIRIPNSTFENSNFTNATESLANDTFSEYAEIPYYIKATSMTFCIVIMCLGVVGNVMVPIVILKTKDMRNSTNIFLVNLSIADLMVLLVCTPTVLVEVNSKPETWVLGKELCLAVPFIELTVAHASVLTILAISFERYYAICEPLRAGYVCTKTRAALICGGAWLFAALFTSPILAIAEHHNIEDGHGGSYQQCLTQAATFWEITFFIMIIIFLYLLPLIILIILYSIIAKNLISAASKVVMNKTVDPYNVRARKQVILMLGTVVLCFFVCLMPYRILALWIIVTPTDLVQNFNQEQWYNLLYFSRIMLYINSAVNPILYNLMSSKFRLGFCKVCICYRDSVEDTPNLRNSRNRAGTLTNGSTTSSSFSRTTNSLKKLFHRNSLDRSNTTRSEEFVNSYRSEDNMDRNSSFLNRLFVRSRFVRQQSAPSCSNSKIPNKINRMRSEGNMFEVCTVDNKANSNADMSDGETQRFIRHSETTKVRPDIEVDVTLRAHGSLRRNVLINSAKAKSMEGDRRNVTYQKIHVDCSLDYKESKSIEYDLPETYV